jgi:hypothetical protein
MTIENLKQDKEGLFFEPNVKGYNRKDLNWLNSGCATYEDSDGSFFFEAVKIHKGNVFYKKQYYTVNNKIITRL